MIFSRQQDGDGVRVAQNEWINKKDCIVWGENKGLTQLCEALSSSCVLLWLSISRLCLFSVCFIRSSALMCYKLYKAFYLLTDKKNYNLKTHRLHLIGRHKPLFILGSKPLIWPSFLQLGPPIWPLGVYPYFHLHCCVNPSRWCAGNCVRWGKVSMTCTVVRPTAGEF